MPPRNVWKLIAAVIGAISIGVVLLAVAAVTGSMDGRGSSLAALTWIVPIGAGFLVGVVAWALLAAGDRLPSPAHTRCPSCDSVVLEGWRICPHCGHFLGDKVEAGQPADSAVA